MHLFGKITNNCSRTTPSRLFALLPSRPSNLIVVDCCVAGGRCIFNCWLLIVVVLAAGHGKAGGGGMNASDRLSHPVSCWGEVIFIDAWGRLSDARVRRGGAGHWVWVDWVGSFGGSTRRAFHAFRGRPWAWPRCESHFWLWAGTHITPSMRYRSSTTLEGGVTGGSVAGALILNNGVPWRTTFGDGGGRNNCWCSKNLGLGLDRAFFTKKIICCQTFCATYVCGMT